MEEIWKPVRGKEEYAEISNYGQIHYYAGKSRRYPDEHWTYGGENSDGYLNATIGGVNKGIHIWVFMTFNDCDIPKGMEVNHLDENPKNNRLDNLNLMTPKENSNWGTRNERIAAANRGKPNPKVSAALRGRKHSPEHNAKVAAANRGRKLSEEHKAKLSAAHSGKHYPKLSAALKTSEKVKIARTKVAASRSKAVQALDPKTLEVVYEFPSTQEAQRQGFSAGNISECCLGKRKTHKGYIWRFAI